MDAASKPPASFEFGRVRILPKRVGRSYRFTGDVRARRAGQSEPAEQGPAQDVPGPPRAPTNLPGPTSDLMGRDIETREVIGLVADHRLVTLIGTGGIGKTRLGLEVARYLLPQFADGVWIAELALLSDPALVPVTVATALGLELVSGVVSPERIAASLGSKHIMLVLDNCEHVIDAAAGMVEALLHANPAARVIATSREPLRAESEHLYRVPPLAVPTEDTQVLKDVLRHGAVALFIARAQEAADAHFAPNRQTASAIAAICRRLDGIRTWRQRMVPALKVQRLKVALPHRQPLASMSGRDTRPGPLPVRGSSRFRMRFR